MSYSPIAILGYAQTSFGELWDISLRDLFYQSSFQAIDDAHLKPSEIDAVYISNMASGNYEYQMHLNSLVSSFFPHHPPSFHLEAACASGGLAIVAASHSLQAKKFRHVLVVGAEKMTDVPTEVATKILSGAADVNTEYGSTFPGLYALLAEIYQSRYQLSSQELRRALSLVSSRAHTMALSNPYAQFHKTISPETASASPDIASPLKLLDCSPLSDGAAAVVLCLDPHKKDYPTYPHLIGVGHSQDSIDLASRTNLPHITATTLAAKEAFQQTSLSPKDISVLELHDCFTIAEILAIEDLGFLSHGTAVHKLNKNGYYLPGITVNPSGGLKACGHPVGATGIKQIGIIANYLQSNSTPTKYGLTHNVGGSGGTVIVHIVEKGKQ